jgi:hypothetical protein
VTIVSRSLVHEKAWGGRYCQEVGLASDSLVLQRFSCIERVTGIEPALSAWESDTDPPSTLRGPI